MAEVSVIKLYPEDMRYTTRPIFRHNVWKWYVDARDSFWTPNDISMTTDAVHYETLLTEGEKRFVKYILAFFAASDKIVAINVVDRLRDEIRIFEATYFFNMQVVIEDIHADTYSLLLDTIIPSAVEKHQLLNAIQTMPVIKKMSDYIFKIIESEESLAARLLRTACVEGIFFTSCFCVIYWLSQRGLMPGLSHSNELISRDEALHTMFAMFMYDMIESEFKLSIKEVYDIIDEAVSLAKEFIAEALPIDLPEMNYSLMSGYIECQADNLISLIDIPIRYGSKHEFHFMNQINFRNRTNFFERRVSEYSKPKSQADDHGHDEDF